MYNPFGINKITNVERLKDGSFWYEFGSGKSSKQYTSDRHKLDSVLCNPAALRVFKLQCDTFSLGETKAFNDNEEIENDALVLKLDNPNQFQTGKQFKWDYIFHLMTFGTAYLYSSSKVIKDDTQLYWLNPSCLVWTDELIKSLSKITLSKGSFQGIEKLTIQYEGIDGKHTPYSLGDITPFFDLTNGLGNWYRGESALDALYKVIQNSDDALDAKNSNLLFSAKFMVTGKNSGDDTSINGVIMGESEKESAESKLLSKKNVNVLKTPIEVSRFVDNIDKLKLDEAYYSSSYKIGLMYGIPREVQEADLKGGATFENTKEIKAGWVEQSLKSKSDDLMEGLKKKFNYNGKLVMSYWHLSFMQIFKTRKQEAIKLALDNLKLAQELGIDEKTIKDKLEILMNDE